MARFPGLPTKSEPEEWASLVTVSATLSWLHQISSFGNQNTVLAAGEDQQPLT